MAALLFALAVTLPALADPPEPRVEVVGTAFAVTLPDGRQAGGDGLVGMILTLGDPGGGQRSIRIDAVQADPKDGEITYALSVLDPASGAWQTCALPMRTAWRWAFRSAARGPVPASTFTQITHSA